MLPFGINLTAPEYWSTGNPFRDHMRLSSPLEVTPNPDGSFTSRTKAPLLQRPTSYDLIVKGVTSVRINGASDPLKSQPRLPAGDTIRFTADPAGTHLALAFTSPAKTFSAIMVPTDLRTGLEAGDIFNPEFVARTTGFGSARFMNWANVNVRPGDPPAINRRVLTTERSFAGLGVPIEYQADLCNRCGTDMYANVSHEFFAKSPPGVATMLNVGRRRLTAPLKMTVELSNEIAWNTRFQQAKDALTKAGGADDWYGVQSGLLANMLPANAFISIAHQFGNVARLNKTLAAYKRTSAKPIGSVNCAPYLTPPDKALVANAARTCDADAVIDSMAEYQERQLKPWMAEWAQAASAVGAKAGCYEVFWSLYPENFPGDKARTTALFAAVIAHPRAAALLMKHANDLWAAGFETLHLFNDNGQGDDSFFGLARSPQDPLNLIGQSATAHNDEAWLTNSRGWLGAARQ